MTKCNIVLIRVVSEQVSIIGFGWASVLHNYKKKYKQNQYQPQDVTRLGETSTVHYRLVIPRKLEKRKWRKLVFSKKHGELEMS